MRLLGIDYGDKRIGVAITDELCMLAHPLTTINRNGSDEFTKLSALIKEYNITSIVIGLPYEMDDKIGRAAEKVKKFVDKLKKHVDNLPVSFFDERMTSKETENELRKFGVSRKKRQKKIDMLSARLILENYLREKICY